jgi:hypothetical protein
MDALKAGAGLQEVMLSYARSSMTDIPAQHIDI